VSFAVLVGLLLSVATAFVSILGFLLKARGASQAAMVSLLHPLRSSIDLFRNRWWTLGILVAMGSWGLHVGALALAPISLVQTVIAGGLVFLTVVASGLFGHRVKPREWAGVTLMAIGLAVLAATAGSVADSARSSFGEGAWLRYTALCSVVALALCLLPSVRRGAGALVLAISAGLMWGASDVTIKALSDSLSTDGLAVLVDPKAALILLLSLAGFVVSARSLQIGDAVPVIATTSAAANISTISAGPLVFIEPFPSGPGGAAVRLLAFALVVVAASLTPAGAPADSDSDPEPA
jgi:hypothetical protein